MREYGFASALVLIGACMAFDDAVVREGDREDGGQPPTADAGDAGSVGRSIRIVNVTRNAVGLCRGKHKLRVFVIRACENAIPAVGDAASCSGSTITCGAGGHDLASALLTLDVDLPLTGSDDPFDVDLPPFSPTVAGSSGVRLALSFHASITRVLPRVLLAEDIASGTTVDATGRSLLAGDVTASDVINSGDVAVAKAGSCALEADVNCDGVVDDIDVDLIKASSGAAGEPCQCPP